MVKDRHKILPSGTSMILVLVLQLLLNLPLALSSNSLSDMDMLIEGKSSMHNSLILQLLSASGELLSSSDSPQNENFLLVSIPPLLVEGPPKGELLYRVTHDPEKEPENLTIPCKADGLPLPSYSWFKDGVHFNTEAPNVKMSETDGTVVFPNPKAEDEGDYQCVATNSAGSVFSDIVNVRRAVTISFPKGDPRVVTAVLGQPLALKCDNPGGYPVPTLHWVLQKSDGSLRSVSSERATVDDEGTLWFGTVTLEDASEDALYACAASSATSLKQIYVVEGSEGQYILEEVEPEGGSYVSLNLQTEYRMGNWAYLNVTAAPAGEGAEETQVDPFLQYSSPGEITILKGEDLKIFCIYGGHPMPKVKWWKANGDPIKSENVIEFGKALQFLEISPDEEGTYMCQATNEEGESAVNSFEVKVESVPDIVVEPGTINQPAGLSATFHCKASGEPAPTITWSFNGEPLPNHNQEKLTFESLAISDKGVIACNASNKHGYDYSPGFLNVVSLPPEFLKQPEDVSALAGEKILLPCEAYGGPDPNVEWKKVSEPGGAELELSDGDHHFEVSKKHLIINSLSEDTQGTYKCIASNKYGTVETSVEVKLIRSTVVHVRMDSPVVKAGDTVTIHCEVAVDDRLSADVTWMKDDSPVDFSSSRITSEKGEKDSDPDDDSYDRVLTIVKTEGSDTGVYSCISNTQEDQAEGFVILTVEDVPEAPVIDEVECSASEAYIHWSSKGENSAPITTYKIETQTELHLDKWEDIENDIPATKNSFSVKLTPGLTHIFRVIAINRVGPSDPSASSDPACTAEGAPPDDNPSNTVVKMVDSSTLRVSWNAINPKEHNGPDFRYVVSWKIFKPDADEGDGDADDDDKDDDTKVEGDDDDEDESWSKLVIEDWEQTEIEIDGLRPHTRYLVRVAAVNEHGPAPTPEDMLIYTEEGVPENAPTFLRVRRIMDATAILFWVPVPANKIFGPLVGYEIDIQKVDSDDDDDDDDALIVSGQTSRADLSGLDPYTKYEARVRVVNKKFSGPYTDPITFRTAQGDSSPVRNIKARSLSSTSLVVEWDVPEDPNGVISSYVIHYLPVYEEEENGREGTQLETVVEDEELQAKLTDLEENTLYTITVFARNKRGLGEGSSVEARTEKTESSIPVPPVFSWQIVEHDSSTTTTKSIVDRDNDDDVDDDDRRLQNVILTDVDGDGDVDQDDVLDTDSDGDIDKKDIDVADINNDGVVDDKDVTAADRDGDGDVDEYDIGDEDGDGDFDAHDVIIADEDNDGDIDAADDDEENIILQDFDKDGDIDEDDATDVDGDGDIDEKDLQVLDVDDDGDIDADDVKIIDKDGDGDIDAADILDLDEDGKIDEDDFDIRDVDDDGDIDRADFMNRDVFVADTDGDGDVDEDDVLDFDRDGDIDKDDIDVADINNDGEVDSDDIKAADRDGDGDVDATDIGDEDGDGDVDGTDVKVADEDGDGDIDAEDDDEEGVLFEDSDGDGDLDVKDVKDVDGDGDIDEDDVDILDVNDDGKIDKEDLEVIDKDGDGDVDNADIADFDGDGKIDEDDFIIVDRDGDGDVDARDIENQHVYLKDIDNDGDIDIDDVLDVDGDGDVDREDIKATDLDDDGDVDAQDLSRYDKDGDGDIDEEDATDLDGDGKLDEDDFDVTDRDGDGDIDEHDYEVKNIFLTDADEDGDVDEHDVLDTDGDGDVDKEDFDVADINNDGKVNEKDIKAGDVDKDGDVDIADIGDEDGDGDIDGDDVVAADEDKDGDIDAKDDDGESILLTDKDKDGDIDINDIGDVDGDGDVDDSDKAALDIDNDGDIDQEDLERGDRDNDGDIDAADITDLDGDGDVDGEDIIISDRDGDGDIDDSDRRNKDIILADADNDGDVDSEDVLDTDKDGDIDDEDFSAADINNDGKITIDDVLSADQDGDGDVDTDDIDDIDGDGDIDADDLEAADADGDGDIDRADRGEGIDVNINWRPDFEGNPGSKFYLKYRPVGDERWQQSPVEEKSLHQTLRGLDPYSAYEVQMVAKDGDFETPSNITIIGPFALPEREDDAAEDPHPDSYYDVSFKSKNKIVEDPSSQHIPEKEKESRETAEAIDLIISKIVHESTSQSPTLHDENEFSLDKETQIYVSEKDDDSSEEDEIPIAPSFSEKEDEAIFKEYEHISKSDVETEDDHVMPYSSDKEDQPLIKEYDLPKAEGDHEDYHENNIILQLEKEDEPLIKEYDLPKAESEYEDTDDNILLPIENEDRPVVIYEHLPKADENQEGSISNISYVLEKEDEPLLKEYDDLPKAHGHKTHYEDTVSPLGKEDTPSYKEYDGFPKASEEYEDHFSTEDRKVDTHSTHSVEVDSSPRKTDSKYKEVSTDEYFDHHIITDESDYIPVLYKDYDDKPKSSTEDLLDEYEETLVPLPESDTSTRLIDEEEKVDEETDLTNGFSEENIDDNYYITDEDYIPVLYKDYDSRVKPHKIDSAKDVKIDHKIHGHAMKEDKIHEETDPPVEEAILKHHESRLEASPTFEYEGSGDDSVETDVSTTETPVIIGESQSIFDDDHFRKLFLSSVQESPFDNKSNNETSPTFAKPLTDKEIKTLFDEHYSYIDVNKDTDTNEYIDNIYDEFMESHPVDTSSGDQVTSTDAENVDDKRNETYIPPVVIDRDTDDAIKSDTYDYGDDDYKHYEDKFKEIGIDAWGNKITTTSDLNISELAISERPTEETTGIEESSTSTATEDKEFIVFEKEFTESEEPVKKHEHDKLLEVSTSESTSDYIDNVDATETSSDNNTENVLITEDESEYAAPIAPETIPTITSDADSPKTKSEEGTEENANAVEIPINKIPDIDESDSKEGLPIKIRPTPFYTNTPESPAEEPTVGAVMDSADPTLMTWFVVAVIVAILMLCAVIFSVWVYNQRLSRVSELRAQLYEGYEPPSVVEKEKKVPDVEAAVQENEVDEAQTAEKQRQQMSALLKRQETVQSVDSFASHDDDFAEYGDETMAIDLLNSVSLITNPKQQGHQPPKA